MTRSYRRQTVDRNCRNTLAKWQTWDQNPKHEIRRTQVLRAKSSIMHTPPPSLLGGVTIVH
jgi:hypothetical protein